MFSKTERLLDVLNSGRFGDSCSFIVSCFKLECLVKSGSQGSYKLGLAHRAKLLPGVDELLMMAVMVSGRNCGDKEDSSESHFYFGLFNYNINKCPY